MKRLTERLDTLETTQAKGATLSGFAGLAELLAGATSAAWQLLALKKGASYEL